MQTDDVQLRQADQADSHEIAALLKNCGLPSDDIPRTIDTFHVALDKGHIVGCAALEQKRNSVLVRSTAVDPFYRDRGIAGRLIERLLVRARGTGAREAYLLSTNAPAYFARWGFTLFPAEKAPAEVKASVTFQNAWHTAAVCMRCELR
ncbi:GNAT family N-acetyltransferase [Ralstonia sp. UBA689]|uniref:GNAT family N-acetyltransferase n=1 Tax=Ralstonia sp. UBA689 TaxID=1947373 RepID=UPI0025F2DF4D|nr:GNAT family N-acetyltransferase [Ralstonia sp. UBA689]